jgi:hypothetical protein
VPCALSAGNGGDRFGQVNAETCQIVRHTTTRAGRRCQRGVSAKQARRVALPALPAEPGMMIGTSSPPGEAEDAMRDVSALRIVSAAAAPRAKGQDQGSGPSITRDTGVLPAWTERDFAAHGVPNINNRQREPADTQTERRPGQGARTHTPLLARCYSSHSLPLQFLCQSAIGSCVALTMDPFLAVGIMNCPRRQG